MGLDEREITRAILRRFEKTYLEIVDVDVVVVGAGPSGLVAAKKLADSGLKVVVFERNLHVGGGMWGGGMLLPAIVVQEEAKNILEEAGARLEEVGEGYYVADPVEAVAKLTSSAIDSGARILVGVKVEDLVIRENNSVWGVVINWEAVFRAKMHVDPLAVLSKAVIDATGHDAEIVNIYVRKTGAKLPTKTGGVVGESSMWADVAERVILENTREVAEGLVVAGMAANAVFGAPRMGPIFGGMFLSGARAAEICLDIVRRRSSR